MTTTKIEYAFGTRLKPIPEIYSSFWKFSRPSWKQVHGIKVCELSSLDQQCGEVDGFWTRKPGLPISVVTADCVPILLYRKDYTAVGALHAGWRGVASHIVREFFHSLPSDFSRPSDWCAVIGPSIRECCYEFGTPELELIHQEFPELKKEDIYPFARNLNLLAPIKSELNALGVVTATITSECTYCAKDQDENARYFSYRRGDRNSRQFSVIQILA